MKDVSQWSRVLRGLCFVGVGLAAAGTAAFCQPAGESSAFIENDGQWDAQAAYLAQAPGVNLWITDGGPVFDFQRTVQGQRQRHVVRMALVGANPTVNKGEGELPGKLNFLMGSDSSQWITGVKRFAAVNAEQPYAGISLRYSIDSGAPRYDLVVKPGADPSQVGLRLEGADDARILPDGNLLLKTSLGDIEERGLSAYQDTPEGRVQVPCTLSLQGRTLRFNPGSYDSEHELIIDPIVASSYLGGPNGSDLAYQVTVDRNNNIYVAGSTQSTDFPVTVGALETKNADSVGTW
jgi:hypothetical protein